MKLTVEIEGDTTSDLVYALEEVVASIENDNTSGFDSNDTGRYSFEITGKPVD